MNCDLEYTGRKKGGRFVHRCKNCKEEVESKYEDPTKRKRECKNSVPRGPQLPPPKYPPLTQEEIDRRLSVCSGCEYWNEEKQGCKVCGTCGSGQAMLSGLMRDPGKRCPHPKGAKWGPPKVLRAAFLAPSLLLGGAERWIASLCTHFDRSLIWPQYIALTEPAMRSDVVEGWLPKDIHVLSADHLPQIMKAVDVLIAWGTKDLAERTKGAKCRIVEVQHGTIGFGKYQRELAAAAINSGAELAAVGEACLDNFPQEHRDNVTVIQNGAELGRLQPIEGRAATREKLGIHPDEKVCLFVGRIAKVKNLDGLAAAMALLPGWRLVVAGPEYQKHHCLGDAIVLPSQEQLGDLFAAADVFCAPSHHEANSLAVIEAWLAGIPAVTTDYPAAVEMEKKHGRMSFLVPVNPSPRVLADAIEEAAKWRSSLAIQNVQAIAMKHYTAAVMADRWQSYLLELCHARV